MLIFVNYIIKEHMEIPVVFYLMLDMFNSIFDKLSLLLVSYEIGNTEICESLSTYSSVFRNMVLYPKSLMHRDAKSAPTESDESNRV